MIKKQLKNIIIDLAVRSAGLIRKSPSILLIFAVVIILNHWPSDFKIDLTSIDKSAYQDLPNYLSHSVNHPKIVALIILGFILKLVISIFVSIELLRLFSGTRIGIFNSILSLRAAHWKFFIAACAVIYSVYGGIGIVSYLCGRYLFLDLGIHNAWALAAMAAGLFPFLYTALSCAATISVFPVPFSRKWQLLRVLLIGPKSKNLYLFYFLRIGVEMVFLILVPLIALFIFRNHIVASVSGIVGLIIPLALLRGAAYEFKIGLIAQNSDIREIFKDRVNPLGS